MNKLLFLLAVGMLLFASVTAQNANIDSLKLIAQINQDQLKLGKLQNMVAQQTKSKQDAAADAQNSASNNASAAERLNNDPTNKKLADNANDKASDAKSDSRKSRKETARLDALNKNIMELKNKISDEQAKLRIYSPSSLAIPAPVLAQADTTRP